MRITLAATSLILCLSLSNALANEPMQDGILSDSYSTATVTHIEYDMFGFMKTETPKTPIDSEEMSYPVEISLRQPRQEGNENTQAINQQRHDKIAVTLLPAFTLFNYKTWGDYGARMDLVDIPLVSIFSTERDLTRSKVEVIDTPVVEIYRYDYNNGHSSINFIDTFIADVYTQQISASGDNNWQFVHVPMVSVMDYRSSAAHTSWKLADVPLVTVADYSSSPNSTSFEFLDIPIVDVLKYERKHNNSVYFELLDVPLVKILEINYQANGSGSWKFLDLPIIGPIMGGSRDHLKILFLEL